MNVINKLLGGLALGMMLYSCGVVPITGRRSLNLVSDEEVLASSRTQYNSFVANSRKKGELVDDPRILKISERLIQATKTYLARNNYIDLWRQMQWEVNVVKSNQVNAFCMPGGKIIVYTGMANLVGLGKGADDELAAVIGHEIGHAIARHANERISRAQLTSMGGQMIAGMLGDKTGISQHIFSTVYGLGTEVAVALPFNRKQELEADKIGLVLMTLAGYNPEYAVSLWQKMSSVSGGKSNSFFSTHPTEEKRIQEIRAYLPQLEKEYKSYSESVRSNAISVDELARMQTKGSR